MAYRKPEHLKTDEFTSEKNLFDLYITSNKRDYSGLSGPPAETARPGTSQFYSDTNTEDTGYKHEFGWKTVEREECQRTGTSSGQRANNPHPKESFMVWKFPDQKNSPQEQSKMKETLMREICRDKLNSTYQVDYKGLQQGEREETDLQKYKQFLQGMKHVPDHTLDTTVRADYQLPQQNAHLLSNTTRYGANSKKMTTTVGAVPTVVHESPLLDLNLRTSYAEEYTDSGSDRCMLKPTAIPALNKYLASAPECDKHVLQNMLHSLNNVKNKPRNTAAAINGPQDSDNPARVGRLSQWDGPSWKC